MQEVKTMLALRRTIDIIYRANADQLVNGVLTLYFPNVIVYIKRDKLIVAPYSKNEIDAMVPIEWYMGFTDTYMKIIFDALHLIERVEDYQDNPVDKLGNLYVPSFVTEGIDALFDLVESYETEIQREEKPMKIQTKAPVTKEREYVKFNIDPEWKDFKRRIDQWLAKHAEDPTEYLGFAHNLFCIRNPRLKDPAQSIYIIDIYLNMAAQNAYNDPKNSFMVGRLFFGPDQIKMVINFPKEEDASVITIDYTKTVNEFTATHRYNLVLGELLYEFAVSHLTNVVG